MTAPDSPLFNLLPKCKLVTIVHEANDGSVIFKLQTAVIRIQGKEQCREHTCLGGLQVLDESFPILTNGCLFVRKLVIH